MSGKKKYTIAEIKQDLRWLAEARSSQFPVRMSGTRAQLLARLARIRNSTHTKNDYIIPKLLL